MKHISIATEFDAAGTARPKAYFGRPKRLMDLAITLALLPVALPLLGVLWLSVRRDGGPGFSGQPRVGRGGQMFLCWKLRTMAVDAEQRLVRICADDPRIALEWQQHQKLAQDPRITPIGRILRRTSLDELPQIWNVLRGDMSLVGPRPFTLDQLRLYAEAGGSAYFHLRPGITGPWQVEGRNATRFVDRVQYDETYFHDACAWGDLRLLLRTTGVVAHMTGR